MIIPKTDSIKKFILNGGLTFIFCLLSVVILPTYIHYLPPVMILWVLFWIMDNRSGLKKDIFISNKAAILFSLFIFYYLWQAVGLIYTTDTKMGLSNLFGRLSLVLFPLVLIFPGAMIKNNIKTLIRIFVISTFLFMLFCFSYALYRSVNLQEGLWTFNSHPEVSVWLNYFYSSELTVSQHPSYIAMYVLLSTFICFESYFDFSLKSKSRIMWLILGLLLLMSQYYISSRAGILICMVLVPLYFIVKFKNLGKKRFAWLWIILVFIALVPLIVKNQRVDYLYGRVFNKQVGYERKRDPRILIWESSLKIARKNLLLGVGIGDVRTELTLEYEQIGEEKMAQERLNAHNQFLEVLLENGIIGLTLFVTIFGVMIYIAFAEKNLLYGLFIIIMLGFFMFETILYRLAGVSFFSLFSFLLLHVNTQKNVDRGQ